MNLRIQIFLILSVSFLQRAFAQDNFSMVIMSDTQYFDWRGGCDVNCYTTSCIQGMTVLSNEKMVYAINNLEGIAWPESTRLGSLSGDTIDAPKGVIINGDLTAYFHPWQAGPFKDQYPASSNALTGWGKPSNVPKYNIYPGLGNHDYDNNVGSCYYGTSIDHNLCAKNAIWYMADLLQNNLYTDSIEVSTDMQRYVTVTNDGWYTAKFLLTYWIGSELISVPVGAITRGLTKSAVIPNEATGIKLTIANSIKPIRKDIIITSEMGTCFTTSGSGPEPVISDSVSCPLELPDGSTGSLSYSYDIGNYHFVQLHYNPNYERLLPTKGQHNSFQVTNSIDWLKNDLQNAEGKKVFINMHWIGPETNTWPPNRNSKYYLFTPAFLDAINGQDILAIFNGHFHSTYGRKFIYEDDQHNFPIFFDGSAECLRFLILNIREDLGKFVVGVVNASGEPFIIDAQDDCQPNMCEQYGGENCKECIPGVDGYTYNRASSFVTIWDL